MNHERNVKFSAIFGWLQQNCHAKLHIEPRAQIVQED
jgi:hypothetical protein